LDLPAGVRNISYAKDMAIFRTRTHWFLLLLLLVLLVTAPLYWNGYWLDFIRLTMIVVISATGLNILTGYCGQLSIGHAGFMAVGAFTSAILTARLGAPFLIALPAAGIMAGLVGILFGMPSLRVKGFYLAISTLAAQFIIVWVISHWSVTSSGLAAPAPSFGGIVLQSHNSKYYLVLAVAALTIFLAKNLARTRTGRAFIAIRDNDLAAEVMGINLFRYKLLAFFIGCFFAGIAGSLFVHCWTGFVTHESFSFNDSILYVGLIIIGGLGTGIGPIFGAVFIGLLRVIQGQISPLLISTFGLSSNIAVGVGPILYGLAIILFLIFEPRGLAHRWQLFKASYRLWPFSY
jgi:branched-chain amino acid transport system permease protein